MSRNGEEGDIKIRYTKRYSLFGNKKRNDSFDLTSRIGHSDSLKPYKPEELTNIYDPKPKSLAVLNSSKSRHSTKPSTTGSVRSKLKQIIRNKAQQT
jgi:hypothetical protein